ncbi:hypothetical protein ACWV95_13785 [Streptomyces albus]
MGDHEGMHLYATNMIKGSMGLVDVMKGVRDTTIALSTELGARQKGMAGDDDAGHNFSKVYTPAAKTTLDQLGFSAYVVGQTGAGLMRTAREFMAQEDKFVAAILGKQQDLTAGMADPSDGCDGEFLNRGQKLPDVVGDTAWHHQYLASQRFRGDAGKARDVASSWRQAGKILDRLLDVAQGCARAANKAHGGGRRPTLLTATSSDASVSQHHLIGHRQKNRWLQTWWQPAINWPRRATSTRSTSTRRTSRSAWTTPTYSMLTIHSIIPGGAETEMTVDSTMQY